MNISVEPGARSPLHNESQKEDMVMFIRQKRENEKKEHLKEILNKKYLFVVVLILLCCIGACGNDNNSTGGPVSMGEGGYLYIINGTLHNFIQQSNHSYQMNSWSFPQVIPPGTTRVYIEWDMGPGKCWCDDSGDVWYQVDGTSHTFHLHGSGNCGTCLDPHFDLTVTYGDNTHDIGWRWNGWSPPGGVSLLFLSDTYTFDDLVILTRSDYNLSQWMGGISDKRLLTTLTIPGTHDSGTYAYSGAAGLGVWTQDRDFTAQLLSGIRFLDMRCTSVSNGCELYHSSYDLGINLDNALNQIVPFLQAHSSETVLMSIKQENSPVGSSLPLDQVINNYIQRNPNLWYTNNSIPTLGQVRGKIVLLRRYSANTYPLGIDLSNWPDNTTFTLTNSGGVTYSVQDNYAADGSDTGTNPSDKKSDITNQFNAAKVNDPHTLYINFTSSYYYPYALDPKDYASHDINPWLYSALQWGMGDPSVPDRTRLGIVPLNYFDLGTDGTNGALPLLLIAYNSLNAMVGNQSMSLIPGQYMLSNNGDYELIYQGDGNLVEYYHFQEAVWASKELSSSPGWAVMQPDGNLVTYDSNGHPYWASGTSGNSNSVLFLDDSGRLVIQNSNGVTIKTLYASP